MASGGQKLPAFPRELPESSLSNRRCQPSAPHLTHTQMGLMAHWSPPCGHPAWILHYLRQPGPLLQGRHWEMGAPMLGKTGTGHRCAGQGCPSNHNTQENAKPAPWACSIPCPARGCKLTRLPTLGRPAPQVSLCPGMPHALPTAQDLASAQELWWPESSNTQPVCGQMESQRVAHWAMGLSCKGDLETGQKGDYPAPLGISPGISGHISESPDTC